MNLGNYFINKDIFEGGNIMKTIIATRSIVFGIILVCIGASVASATEAEFFSPQPSIRGDILYVGGSGPGNYTSIQEAIDNSTNGDTIFVYNGTYNENIDTKIKEITLQGEDRDITTITGAATNPVVKIGTSDTTIKGFTLTGTPTSTVLQVISLGENILITDNIIKDGANGIVLAVTTSKVTITNNIVKDNAFIGIQLTTSSYDIISDNRIAGNGAQGIGLQLGSNHNSITDNVISDNGEEAVLINGITSTENTISGNNITNNNIGVRFSSAGSNKIQSNNIQGSAMEGVLLQTSNENTIEKNNFIDNKRQATFKLSSRNTWDANYWSNWIGFKLSAPIFQNFPKFIVGGIRINLDRNPAKVPYNITVGI
jgi:nitrous oxidase accessory protein